MMTIARRWGGEMIPDQILIEAVVIKEMEVD
jgi:hypothetical protein